MLALADRSQHFEMLPQHFKMLQTVCQSWHIIQYIIYAKFIFTLILTLSKLLLQIARLINSVVISLYSYLLFKAIVNISLYY